ncbi:Replication initiation and membrane attachment [Macrococcoides caseolyticum]|uniref:DnaD domain-containing protein n=1 Tax=Macrococcoides caseolyticum TaxID=69966 RepID=UPI000A296C42|nr:DnaD domain protein [Macrococcus caseolyticus]ARQ03932.1 Replication initiation and membrane attachment [Macrococcus caseolyticus]
MQRPGYLKLHRALVEKPIWKQSTPEHKAILIQLLIMADFMPSEWEYQGVKYKTEPGQFVTSLQSIADECGKGISVQNVRSALARFERLGFLTNQSTKVNRLITIVNWGIYQAREEKTNKETNNVTNKEVTKNQQRGNKEVTTNEEVKKLRSKEVKNNTTQQNDFSDVFIAYQQNIEMVPPQMTINKISDDFDAYGKDVMMKAIEKSAFNGNHDYKFINFLLNDWRKRGLKDVKAIELYEEQRETSRQRGSFKNNQQPQSKEMTPSWINQENTQKQDIDEEELERERQKLLEELNSNWENS